MYAIRSYYEMFNMSFEVYKKSDGAFDITVAPVVNAWGFGWIKKTETEIPDSAEIAKIIKSVGMDKMHLADGKITKDFPESMIVTNAIAQGLSVDYVSDYLFGVITSYSIHYTKLYEFVCTVWMRRGNFSRT